MSYYDPETYGGGRKYLGKDVMGSVWGVTDDYGVLRGTYLGRYMRGFERWDEPWVHGDDVVMGMYNYGYRDYKAEGGGLRQRTQ
jgi:hypothetical protein